MALLILIADDDLGIRVAVKDYLELVGYSVITAQNGEEALSMLDRYHPHLLVSDIKMPKKDGYSLVRHLRQRPEFRLLPVVFLTERGSTQERIQGYQVGCDVYLPKPFEMDELQAGVRKVGERSQMIQSEWRFPEPKETFPENSPNSPPDQQSNLSLTEREIQVLKLLADGLSNNEIGQKLHLSPRTIEKYVSSLLRKTETTNRAELVRFTLDHHLID